MQIITFGRQTVATCHIVFRAGSVDPNLDAVVGHLNKVFLDMKTTLAAGTNASDSTEKELFLIADRCKKVASQLMDEAKAVTVLAAKGQRQTALDCLGGVEVKVSAKEA